MYLDLDDDDDDDDYDDDDDDDDDFNMAYIFILVRPVKHNLLFFESGFYDPIFTT